MSWKQWAAVVVVIGGGIVLQIPDHDASMMGPDGTMEMGAGAEMEHLQTVELDVTGMT